MDNYERLARKILDGLETPDKLARVYVRKELTLEVEAHYQAARAIANGTLIRGEYCEACGTFSRRLNGHHDDYAKPLDVRWLCQSCHKVIHPSAQSTANSTEA